jgi:hypothetical protein
MNSLGSAARGALILLVALLVSVFVLSRVTGSPTVTGVAGGSDGGSDVTTTLVVTTSTLLPPRNPKTVKVLMVNGTKANGIAKAAGLCLAATYDVVPPLNAVTKPVPAANLYAASGFEAEAADVAAKLGFAGAALPIPVNPGVKNYPSTPEAAPNVMMIIDDQLSTIIKGLPCSKNPVP